MQQFFVSADTAQFVSFAAKLVVGFTIPRIASLLTLISTPKALVFFFYGNFGNLAALVTDLRWFKPARNSRSKGKTIYFSTWFTIVIAIITASAVLVTDLLLFQLADRKDGYKFKEQKNVHWNFTDSLSEANYPFPDVILSNGSSNKIFGDKIYMSNDNGRYMNYSVQQRVDFLVDGPQGNIDAKSLDPAVNGTPRCTVTHEVTSLIATGGTMPVQVKCFFDNFVNMTTSGNGGIQIDTVWSEGMRGSKIASYYQTEEGANYLFVELVQRGYDFLQSSNKSTGIDMLQRKADSLVESGFEIEFAVAQGYVPPLSNNTETMIDFAKFSEQRANATNATVATTVLLMSKTTLSYNYGRVPVYTKNYILITTIFTVGFFEHEGYGNYYSYSYNTRQYLVPNRSIRPNIIGVNFKQLRSPQSVQISTDATDDEIFLATLVDPKQPIRVIPTVMIDIFPALVVVGVCGVFVLVSFFIILFAKRHANSGLSFDINLEVFHKAIENIDGLNAWYLPAKLERTSAISMSAGESLVSHSYEVGLVSKGISTGVDMGKNDSVVKTNSVVQDGSISDV